MKKIFISLLISLTLVIGLNVLIPQVIAQDASPTPSQEPSPETTDNLRARIEKIVEEQKEKVQSLLGTAEVQRQGFIGQVVRVSETTLTLDSRGVTRIVPLDETVVLQRGTAVIKPETIEIGQWALVLGLRRAETFMPRKIVFSTASPRPDPHLVQLGTLKAISNTTLDFQPRGQEEIISVVFAKTTQFQDSLGVATRLTEFVEDDQVLLVGYQANEKTMATVMRALAPFSKDE